MTITYHKALTQGSDEWLSARRGMLTASEMGLIVTPTFKAAANDKERSHMFELLAQRISGFTEPHYVSNDMLRGHEEEVDARMAYEMNYGPVAECGFITNDRFGFHIGYSPDALVGDDGLLECKSRRQKYQVQTILEHVKNGTCPTEYVIQIQTGLLVSERKWCDFISYSGGLPMMTVRVYPDKIIQDAIESAARGFEDRLQKAMASYFGLLESKVYRLLPTERKVYQEMHA